jgi:hypothetical protein
MNKLCCCPSEVPDIEMNVKCVSTCCARNVRTKDTVDNINNETNREIDDNNNNDKIFCCCFKRRNTSQAKVDKKKRGEKDG